MRIPATTYLRRWLIAICCRADRPVRGDVEPVQELGHVHGAETGPVQVRVRARLGRRTLRRERRRLRGTAVPAGSRVHGPGGRLQVRVSAGLRGQTLRDEGGRVRVRPVPERRVRGPAVRAPVRVPSRVDGRRVRDERGRLRERPVRRRRRVHGPRGRLFVRVRRRLHRQTVPALGRRLRVRPVPERRVVHRHAGRVRVPVQARLPGAAVRGGHRRVPQRPVQLGGRGTVRGPGQRLQMRVPSRVRGPRVRAQRGRLRVIAVHQQRQVSGRRQHVHVPVSGRMDRQTLRRRHQLVPQPTMSQRRDVHQSVPRLFLCVRIYESVDFDDLVFSSSDFCLSFGSQVPVQL